MGSSVWFSFWKADCTYRLCKVVFKTTTRVVWTFETRRYSNTFALQVSVEKQSWSPPLALALYFSFRDISQGWWGWLDQLARDQRTHFAGPQAAGGEWHQASVNLGQNLTSTHEIKHSLLTACFCPCLIFPSVCFVLLSVLRRLFCLLLFQTSKASDTTEIRKGSETYVVSETSAAGAGLCGKAIQGPGGKTPADGTSRRKARRPRVSVPCLQHLAASTRGWQAAKCCRQRAREDSHGCHLRVLLRETCSSLPLVWACKLKEEEKTKGVDHPQKWEGMMAVDAAPLTTGVFCLSISMLRDGSRAASGASGVVG